MKGLIILLLLLGTVPILNGQLTVDGTLTPQQLVNNILVGSGVTVSNITYNGDAVQIGSFNSLNANVGFSEGVILASGDINNAIGPNNNGGASTSIAGPADPDLDVLSGIGTNDAAVLEFDFIPVSSEVNFDYVFASEEYMEFVGGGVNDAFGFFISGPGIVGPYQNGAENIAVIPGTTTQVTIDDLNANSNAAYYIDNGDGFTAPQSTDNTYVQYDGLTQVMTASATVTPCETYHIKIVIADGGDTSFDSGVFLKAASFSAETIEITSSGFSGADSVLIEGCSNSDLIITLPFALPDDFVLDFTLSGTATIDDDFTLAASPFVIPQGDTIFSVPINIINDNLLEGQEQLIINFNPSICIGVSIDSVIIYIDEAPPILIQPIDDVLLCPGTDVDLIPIVSGGIGAYQFAWSDGLGTDSVITVSPFSLTEYTVTVTDACNTSITEESVEVSTVDISVPNAGEDQQSCHGTQLNLGEATATTSNYIWTPIDNLSDPNISDPSINIVNLGAATITQEYILTASENGCELKDSVMVTMYPIPDPQVVAPSSQCLDGNSFDFEASGGFENNASTIFNWNFASGTPNSSMTASPNGVTYGVAGTYSFTLEVTSNGCVGSMEDSVSIIEKPTADFDSTFIGSCLPFTVNLQDLSISNSVLDYNWIVGVEVFTNQNPQILIDNSGFQDVMLEVSTIEGCKDTLIVQDMIEGYSTPQSSFVVNDTLSEFYPISDINSTAINADASVYYIYSGTTLLDSLIDFNTNYNFVDTGSYEVMQVVMTNEGCLDTSIQEVVVIPDLVIYVPNAFIPDGDTFNDIWKPVGAGVINYELLIYDRWGILVFETKDFTQGWNGTFMNTGKPLPMGVYVYIIKATDSRMEEFVKLGHVSIIK